jgi:hypothetical protein
MEIYRRKEFTLPSVGGTAGEGKSRIIKKTKKV